MEDNTYSYTTHYNLPYPNDSTESANAFNTFEDLAKTIDTAVYNVVGNVASVLDQINGEVI